MSVLHIVALAVAACIQGVSGNFHPAFTGYVNCDKYIPDPSMPVSFDKIKIDGTSMYDTTNRSVSIHVTGVYWITLNVEPACEKKIQLVLKSNGQKTKLLTWIKGFQSSRSWAVVLRVGDRLTVWAKGKEALASHTFWSVAYIGSNKPVFSAWAGLTSREVLHSHPERIQQDTVSFRNLIFTGRGGIWQNRLREFTISVSCIYLVHLSAVGDKDLILILQRQKPHQKVWEDLLVAGSNNCSQPSSVDAVFNFGEGTKLRVFRKSVTSYPSQRTLLSMVGIGLENSAFTGETEPTGPLGSIYKEWQPVRFENVHINTYNDYNPASHVYTAPFDSIYIASLRPYTKPVILRDKAGHYRFWPCCQPLTFYLNNANRTELCVTAEAWAPSGTSAAIHLQAGDKLQVFPHVKGYRDSNVWYGSLFSIVSLQR